MVVGYFCFEFFCVVCGVNIVEIWMVLFCFVEVNWIMNFGVGVVSGFKVEFDFDIFDCLDGYYGCCNFVV